MSVTQNVVQKDNIPNNIIYFDLSTLVIMGSISANYERILSDNFSLRGGIGFAYFTDKIYFPTMLMCNFLTKGENKFEIGLGGSLITENYNPIKPAFSVGYRYQDKNDGFVFRTGLSWVFYYGMGFHLSLGKAF